MILLLYEVLFDPEIPKVDYEINLFMIAFGGLILTAGIIFIVRASKGKYTVIKEGLEKENAKFALNTFWLGLAIIVLGYYSIITYLLGAMAYSIFAGSGAFWTAFKN